jgi:hypothetical protein
MYKRGEAVWGGRGGLEDGGAGNSNYRCRVALWMKAEMGQNLDFIIKVSNAGSVVKRILVQPPEAFRANT